jgi:hypothetical protein
MMEKNQKNLVFVTGSGRCGTAALAKLMSKAKNSFVMHEGTVEPPLNEIVFSIHPMFVENLEAYLNPHRAEELLIEHRVPIIKKIIKYLTQSDRICDAALYYWSFLSVIPRVFPHCRVAIIVRDGRHYVRSATSTQVPDPKPVGYGPADEITSKRFPLLFKDRLRPGENSRYHKSWPTLTSFQKNAWVWAETYKTILGQIPPADQT